MNRPAPLQDMGFVLLARAATILHPKRAAKLHHVIECAATFHHAIR